MTQNQLENEPEIRKFRLYRHEIKTDRSFQK